MKSRIILVLLALLMAPAPGAPGPGAAPSGGPGRGLGPGGAERHDAAVPVAWFDLLYELVRAERLSPPVASRRIGYAGVALYEAIAPGVPGGRSLAGQLNGLVEVPVAEPHAKYHWPAVADAALAGALRGLFAGASDDTLAAIDLLEAEFAETLRTQAPPPVLARSEARGRAVAAAILAWAATDGLADHDDCPYVPPQGEGLWEPTPPAFAPPLQPCWGRLRPFVLVSGAECEPGPHPVFSIDPASAFHAEAREVYDTTAALTPTQQAIALFWADNPGQTGTPPGHWIAIVGQVARDDGLSLDVAAEAYARTGLAVADAFISCWEAKYRYNLLRPITYIRTVIDAGWTPPIGTPPFPEYTSGHSVQSAAAATVLGDLLGPLPFTDDTHAPLGLPARSFGSFEEAAAEAAVSRLYGGIHYRAAIDNGLDQGRCIGDTIVREVRFRDDD